MNRGRIRLRPTGLWLVFGPILGCMWLAAVNYSNNLVYAVLYLVGSLTFVSVFHTWRNLAALEVDHLRVHSTFAGGQVRVEVHFRNRSPHPVYGVALARLEGKKAGPLTADGLLRIEAGETKTVELFFPAPRRGCHRFESLQVESSYPFGLVQAGFRCPVRTEYFIYPGLRGDRPLPEPQAGGGLTAGMPAGDDFAGLRPYAPGESLRHIDWKAYARGRPLAVKHFAGGEERELWLDAADLSDLPLEEALSQLARWVVEAGKEEIPYALRWRETVLPLDRGTDQARRALEILAAA